MNTEAPSAKPPRVNLRRPDIMEAVREQVDFGMAFGRTGDYFDGVFLTKRASRGLLDPLMLGLLPPLRGLLRDDLVPALTDHDGADSFWRHWRDRLPHESRDLRRDGPAVGAILISHAHPDHIADIAYVGGDIPMAGTCTTAFIAKVLQDIGGGSGTSYLHPATSTDSGIIHSDRSAASCRRPWCFLDQSPSGASTDNPLDSARSFWDAAGTKNGELLPIFSTWSFSPVSGSLAFISSATLQPMTTNNRRTWFVFGIGSSTWA